MGNWLVSSSSLLFFFFAIYTTSNVTTDIIYSGRANFGTSYCGHRFRKSTAYNDDDAAVADNEYKFSEQ